MCLFRREVAFERSLDDGPVCFEEVRQLHSGGWLRGSPRRDASGVCHLQEDSSSASNGSAEIFPSAFFSKISTRPSASSGCFWHSRESLTPSSNNFIASSSESSVFSRRLTTSSRRPSDFSKSDFLGASAALLVAGFTLPQFAVLHLATGA